MSTRWQQANNRSGDYTRRQVLAAGALTAGSQASAANPLLPQILLGRHSISRLICGSNPFSGWNHLSGFLTAEVKRYYTPEQILETLRRCEEAGINCWQFNITHLEMYRRHVDQGGKMKFLAIDTGDGIGTLARGGAIGIAHHGERTDQLYKSGSIDSIRDFLKRVRDEGVAAGISTHMPAVVDTVESKGWEVDFYMTCVYERNRTAEELEKLLGQAPIPVGEVYLPNDPPRMFKAIRATKKPCLAFKILAAGRLSDRRAWVERAFRETFESIKASDGVIVGIYDRLTNQARENAELTRKFGQVRASS